jgi:hypothetical protein
MEDRPRYEFLFERVEASLIMAAGGVVEELDLEEIWEDRVNDGSEWAVLISKFEIRNFIAWMASHPLDVDPQHGSWRSDAKSQLERHDQCMRVLDELVAERDDVIRAIMKARDYCFYDVTRGQYGDLYIDSETFFDQLRPTIRGSRSFNEIDTVGEWCIECSEQWGHAEDCSVERRSDELDSLRRKVIESHVHCVEIATFLVAHTRRCLERVEAIASRARSAIDDEDGLPRADPHQILSEIHIGDLNVSFDASSPATVLATIYPPLEDEDYCDADGGIHASTHRACPYLVS